MEKQRDAASHYLANMPVYRLLVRAELENIESLSAVPDNQWCIDVACGSERKDGVFVSSAESQEVEGSRCDLRMRWCDFQCIDWYTSRRDMVRSHLILDRKSVV